MRTGSSYRLLLVSTITISSSLTGRTYRLRKNFPFEKLHNSWFWETCSKTGALLDWQPFFQLWLHLFLVKNTCEYVRFMGDWWMNIFIKFYGWGVIRYFWLIHMGNASSLMHLDAFHLKTLWEVRRGK